MAAGRPARRCALPGTPRRSSRSRSRARCRAGPHPRLPHRPPGWHLRCPVGATAPITSSGRVSFARRCQGCPLRRRCTTAKGGRTIHLHPTRTSYAPPAAARPPAASSRATGAGGRWWNARWPGWSPTAADRCPTAGPSAMRGGGRCGSPRSTCAGCWFLARLASSRPGHWPDQAGIRGPSTLARPLTSPARPAITLLGEQPPALDRQASAET